MLVSVCVCVCECVAKRRPFIVIWRAHSIAIVLTLVFDTSSFYLKYFFRICLGVCVRESANYNYICVDVVDVHVLTRM